VGGIEVASVAVVVVVVERVVVVVVSLSFLVLRFLVGLA